MVWGGWVLHWTARDRPPRALPPIHAPSSYSAPVSSLRYGQPAPLPRVEGQARHSGLVSHSTDTLAMLTGVGMGSDPSAPEP
jgi:hypothetical protein